jgi:hypothetical protein
MKTHQAGQSLAIITALVIGAFAGADSPRPAPFAHAFGIHGPQYSHWLAAGDPQLWHRADARLRVLADCGAGWARQDFWWGVVEPEPGVWKWTDFDRAVTSYARAGVNLFAILCYGSAWSGGNAPQTDEEIKAFGEYVFRMVQRYQDQVAAWEIWNEPNILPFWAPLPNPELYTKLLREAYTRAKQADPDCIIVGCAFAGPDHTFLKQMYEQGVAGHFDVLSYHNYGQGLDMLTEWPAVEQFREIMAAHGDGDKPIWHTENGFYTGPVGLSMSDQAARLVRYSLGLRALGIARTFQLTINDWSDDPDFHDRSSYRGITHADYRIKPSYRAYQAMCNLLGTASFAGLFHPAEGVTGLLFEEQGRQVAVVWRDWGVEPTPLEIDTGQAVLLTRGSVGELAGARIRRRQVRTDAWSRAALPGRSRLQVRASGGDRLAGDGSDANAA